MSRQPTITLPTPFTYSHISRLQAGESQFSETLDLAIAENGVHPELLGLSSFHPDSPLLPKMAANIALSSILKHQEGEHPITRLGRLIDVVTFDIEGNQLGLSLNANEPPLRERWPYIATSKPASRL